MKTPEGLVSAMDCGIIQEVIRPLMSGKEAQIYVVVAAGVECVAKVYKEATQRTFKHRAEYTEGRRTRNSRDQRAMNKRSQHGRSQDEAGWRSTEADMIRRLRDAGVRVPELLNFVDGVLVMEFVKDAEGHAAPRLGDLSFTASEARDLYQQLLREVARMLSAGVVHGDLSEFNVLVGEHGPVLIDFPQSIGAASNQNARKFLLRDVENLHRFVGRYAPDQPRLAYGEEMWSLYEGGRLASDTELRGDYCAPEGKADTEEVLALIEDADREESERREARGEDPPVGGPKPLRTVVDFTKETRPQSAAKRAGSGRSASKKARPSRAAQKTSSAKAAVAGGDSAPKQRRSRRRRKRSTATGGAAGDAEMTARGSGRSAAPIEKKTVGSGDAESPKRRRRAGRGGARGESGKTKTGAGGNPERPAKPVPDQRGGSQSGAAAGEADRPARRRRRRPRRAGSRKPT